VAISTKDFLHFGKSGLGFLDILFSDFLMEEEDHTCEERETAHGRKKAARVKMQAVPHVQFVQPQQGGKQATISLNALCHGTCKFFWVGYRPYRLTSTGCTTNINRPYKRPQQVCKFRNFSEFC
jgi:hypothetical protein